MLEHTEPQTMAVLGGADSPRVPTLTQRAVVFVDVQTTGASPQRGHLLELAWACGDAVGPPPAVHGVKGKLVALPERFGKMASLEDLSLAKCHALAKNEGTFTILSQIPTLTKLSLANCDMESLPAGIHHPSS